MTFGSSIQNRHAELASVIVSVTFGASIHRVQIESPAVIPLLVIVKFAAVRVSELQIGHTIS